MKITLEEDNGFLNDGKPTLVVLVIDGVHRIPYEASKTIQELYVDAHKYKDEKHPSIIASTTELLEIVPDKPVNVTEQQKSSLQEIEREDIIKCHRLEKDLDGNTNEELEIGKEYRIVNIIKQQRKLVCYEVLDDEADNKVRIPIRPDECELIKKHFKQAPRVQTFEMKKKCENCMEDNAILLNKDSNKYEGECSKCGAKLIEERPVKANV